MNDFEKNKGIEKIEDNEQKEKGMETKELSVEQFAEIVYDNGSKLKSELNSHFLGREIIKNVDHLTKEAQAVYLFNGELYLVKFDVNIVDDDPSGDGIQYNLSPKGISKLENPTEKGK